MILGVKRAFFYVATEVRERGLIRREAGQIRSNLFL